LTGPEDDIPPPQRSPDQLVGLIHVKLDHLRRRRRVRLAGAGAAALSLVLVFAAIAMTRAGTAPATVVHTAQPPAAATSTTPTTGLPAVGGGETPATSIVVPTTAVTTSPPSTPTTVHHLSSSPSTTTSTTLDNPPACTAAEVTVTATTDKPSYSIGEPITVTSSIQNTSGHVCAAPYGSGAILDDPTGKDKNLQGTGEDGEIEAGSDDWDPGAASTLSQSYTFTGRYCTTACMPDVAGTFEVVASWFIFYGNTPNPSATVSFQVTAATVRQAPG
jgi:hypothetical protein